MRVYSQYSESASPSSCSQHRPCCCDSLGSAERSQMDPRVKRDKDKAVSAKKKCRKAEPQNPLVTPTVQTLSVTTPHIEPEHRWCSFTSMRAAARRHESVASCHRPGLKPRPSLPPSCLKHSVSISPTGPSGPAQPAMKGFLSCFW